MINALRLLLADFLSTLVFLAIAAATDQARLAVIAAVATGLVQLLSRLLRATNRSTRCSGSACC